MNSEMFTQVRKSPDVSQSDGVSDGGEDELDLRRPFASFGHVFVFFDGRQRMGLDGGRSGGDGGSLAGSREQAVGFTFVVAEPLLVGLGFLRHFSHEDPALCLQSKIQRQVMVSVSAHPIVCE